MQPGPIFSLCLFSGNQTDTDIELLEQWNNIDSWYLEWSCILFFQEMSWPKIPSFWICFLVLILAEDNDLKVVWPISRIAMQIHKHIRCVGLCRSISLLAIQNHKEPSALYSSHGTLMSYADRICVVLLQVEHT